LPAAAAAAAAAVVVVSICRPVIHPEWKPGCVEATGENNFLRHSAEAAELASRQYCASSVISTPPGTGLNLSFSYYFPFSLSFSISLYISL
jgi:hypothetical protein